MVVADEQEGVGDLVGINTVGVSHLTPLDTSRRGE